MALRKMFSYKHHCDKYGNGHYDSNNGYQTFSTAPCETIDSCRHMSASGFWWLFPRTFTFWVNTIDNDCLFLFGRHILFCAINVGFTSFLSEILATNCALKLLKGIRKYLPRKSMPTWSDLDNLTPLTRSSLGQDSFQMHDFLLCFFFPFNMKVKFYLVCNHVIQFRIYWRWVCINIPWGGQFGLRKS